MDSNAPDFLLPAIEIKDLHVQYRQKRGPALEAVRGLSLTVRPGEIVGFLGPNGAGKSSTLKALLGFIKPQSGSCAIFGHPAGTQAAKSLIGYLPEVALYYPYLTPFETLKLYGGLQGMRGKSLDEDANQLLESLGIASSAHKLNRTLSKGMLQRVGIAQALLGNPKLLILDEVTSGLDPLGRQELRNLLRERVAAGTTLFFSSHELAEVDLLCDRILIVHKGQLIDEHLVPELRNKIGQFKAILGSQSLSFPTSSELVSALINAGAKDLKAVTAQDGSLEDYFVQTIKEAA